MGGQWTGGRWELCCMRWLPACRPFIAETERYALYTYIILYTCSISVLYCIDIVYGI